MDAAVEERHDFFRTIGPKVALFQSSRKDHHSGNRCSLPVDHQSFRVLCRCAASSTIQNFSHQTPFKEQAHHPAKKPPFMIPNLLLHLSPSIPTQPLIALTSHILTPISLSACASAQSPHSSNCLPPAVAGQDVHARQVLTTGFPRAWNRDVHIARRTDLPKIGPPWLVDRRSVCSNWYRRYR